MGLRGAGRESVRRASRAWSVGAGAHERSEGVRASFRATLSVRDDGSVPAFLASWFPEMSPEDLAPSNFCHFSQTTNFLDTRLFARFACEKGPLRGSRKPGREIRRFRRFSGGRIARP